MQNCLQSQKRTTKRIIVKWVLACCLMVLLCVAVTVVDNEEKAPIKAIPKYLDITDPKMVTPFLKKTSLNMIEKGKMNNFREQYSKIEHENVKSVPETKTEAFIYVLCDNGTVEKMSLDEYVLGCLVGEMPLSFHPQALMAQSVAVRSFTVDKVKGISKHKNADVCTNPACCQKYISPDKSGYDEEIIEKARCCVNATKNVVAVYDGKVINAVYHASSGERTKDSRMVWGGQVDYLKSVKSPDGEEEIFYGKYSGKGGHGVGMSQQGANLLAKEGKSYVEILTYYYDGISFEILK